MTERIYYEDVMCSVFDAKVLSCSRRGDHYEIIPDRSAFYPEGGGQSGDRGTEAENQEKRTGILLPILRNTEAQRSVYSTRMSAAGM